MTEYREMVIKIPEKIINFVNLNGFLIECYRREMGRILLDGVELPKEHGRLIDADKINFDSNYFYNGDDTIIAEETINDMPTIIEARKGNKNDGCN